MQKATSTSLHESRTCDAPLRCPHLPTPAGAVQVSCLLWAGARQANRVRQLYLASLLSQVGIVGWDGDARFVAAA